MRQSIVNRVEAIEKRLPVTDKQVWDLAMRLQRLSQEELDAFLSDDQARIDVAWEERVQRLGAGMTAVLDKKHPRWQAEYEQV